MESKHNFLHKIKTKKVVVTSEITPKLYKTIPQFNLEVTSQETEVGQIIVAFHNNQLCFSSFVSDGNANPTLDSMKALFPNADITYYFNENTELDPLLSEPVIPVLLKGSDFDRKVWKKLLNIPYGETCTYSDVAERMGNIKAKRAVGTSIGHNPLWYFIPCHRVVRKNGIGGYSSSGGVYLKKQLLSFEVNYK